MATFTLWIGSRSFVSGGEYETVEVEGKEIGLVRFEDEFETVRVRIIEKEAGGIVINYVTRSGYETDSVVFEYDSISEAAKEHRFILRKAKLI
jgi:hypothetical protein